MQKCGNKVKKQERKMCNMEYRHELKFLVSECQLSLIEFRLKTFMKQDAHQKDGQYNIRSLYFDDMFDSCMRENENGIDVRSKYRIRIYDKNADVIKLEKKMKLRGMTRKHTVAMDYETCFGCMQGIAPGIQPTSPELEKEFHVQIKTKGMKPVTIVEYERTAFVEKNGNIRITFDRNISGCDKVEKFFEKNIPLVPLLPAGWHVLEVKFDEYLPDYIKDVLEIGTLQRTAFSKYYYARDYKNKLLGGNL